MKLIIAEKVSVAGDIVQALGGHFEKKEGYYQKSDTCVTWCYGHLFKSVKPQDYNPSYKEWTTKDLPLKLFPLKYEPIEKSKGQAEIVCDLLSKADLIIHAGDPDDEGQLLVEEVIEYSNAKAPVKRLLINDPTPAAVKKALNNLKDNKDFFGIHQKALARSAGDMIFGLSMTRAMTVEGKNRGHEGLLSIGRVQTPVLGLVVNRYQQNKNYKESFFYTLTGHFTQNDITFNANWQVSENAPLDEKKRLIDKSFCDNLAKNLKGKLTSIQEISVQEKQKHPPLPFNLVRLQQIANKKYKLTAQQTLDITQALREKYKAISYNRSDCSYLSDEQHAEAPEIVQALISKLTSENFAQQSFDPKIKSAAFNNKKISAHTAIIPTSFVPDLAKLTMQEKQIYLLITIQYLAQFLPATRYNEIIVVLNVEEEVFKTRATQIIDKGFLTILSDEEEKSDENEDKEDLSNFDVLKNIQKDSKTFCEKVDVNQKKTTPPPLFTEASLLAALVRVADFVANPEIKKALKEKDKEKAGEYGGIGTPATRAGVIELLKNRNFIQLEKGKLIPTEVGINYIKMLPTALVQPDLTALWAEKQNEIEQGSLNVTSFINELYQSIEELIKNMDYSPLEHIASMSDDGLQCPKCKKSLKLRPKLVCCSDKECDFKIWHSICQKNLTDSQLKTLIKKGKTSLIKGFTSKQGKKFDAELIMDMKTGSVSFDFPRTKK